MLQKLWVCLMLISITFCSNAQYTSPYNFKFKSYTTSEGLADNTVVKTIKDKNGFLWIATHNGLARFDGLNFKTYTHNPYDCTSLRSIWTCDLLLDDKQTLWASTEFGLCYYHEQKDKFIYINNKKDLQLIYKMPLCKGNSNTIWMACEDGLKEINTVTKSITNSSLNRIADPQFVVTMHNGHLLIGTRGRGIYDYDPVKKQHEEMHIKELPKDVHYMDAFVDGDETWIATGEGLLLLNKQANIFLYSKGKNLTDNSVTQLMCVKKFTAAFGNDKFICGTYNKRLLLFNKILKVFEDEWLSTATDPDGFEPSIIYDIYSEKKMMWLATDRGLYQVNLNNQQQQAYFIEALLNGNNKALVKKVITDKTPNRNLVWLIPWQPYYGIALYDVKTKKIINEWSTATSKNKKKYTDIIRSSYSNNIIASRDSALDFYNVQNGFIKSLQINAAILCMLEDERGNLWLGHEKGVSYVEINNFKIQNFEPDFIGNDIEKNSFGGPFPVVAIKKSNNKLLWLVCRKYGLFSFNISHQKFTPHRQQKTGSFSTLNRCSDLLIKSNDSIWVSTMAGISCYIPSQNKFTNYDMANGLKSTYVYSLGLDDQNNIWGRGNADIFCFNTNTKKLVGSKLNQQYDISCYQQKIYIENNKLLLGHEAGFTIFNTVSFTKEINELPVAIISNCKINNADFYFSRDSSSTLPIRLKYYQNQVNFDLNAIEYNFPEDIEYSYMLEGLEKSWTNAGNKRSISYNHLSPGKYQFAFYVTNTRNKTKSNIAYWAFTIQPAWWQYWWFWPAVALLFALMVVIVAKQRIKKIREKEKLKTAVNKTMAELETKMLRSQMNPHFIFNSLNSIQKYIWENKEEDAAEYLARFAKLMRAILENSRKETVTLKEEIEVMKLYVDLEHRRSNSGFEYTIKADADLIEKNVVIPPLIMQPFIENAIWHGLNKKGSKGNLLIHAFEKDNNLVCVVDDDGIGRQQKQELILTEKKSLGIKITQQRIEKLIETTGQNATVDIVDKIENGKPAGTKVTITLPLQIL